MAHVLIGKPEFLRAEQQSARTGCKMRAHDGSTNVKSMERMLEIAMSDRGGSYNERAVGNRFGHSFVFFGAGQNLGCVHGGARAFKCHIVGVHDPEMAESKVAHRPCGGAYVEGIASIDEDDAQLIEFGGDGQAIFYSTAAFYDSKVMEFELVRLAGLELLTAEHAENSRKDRREKQMSHCKPLAVESSGRVAQM